ncbi:Proline-rich protein PRCC [Macleaya cordata]|uniref:Proline-rich protein PRCC n=1 Tax=Macleaya cordata TaxID=56857 RepID=A0A200PLX6_MACCD|nr:Proline-rich protein PRCC [Macleaya cordata]
MDSLLASYASSDDDDEEQQNPKNSSSKIPSKSTEPSSYFTEPPKTSSVFFSLPKPKSSSVFSSLPPPSSKNPQKNPNNLSSSDPKTKKVIQFKLPLNPSLLKPLDDDEEEEEKPKKPNKESTSSTETSSLKSFFSNLPAPKNSLGLGSGLGSGQSLGGTGRRSIVETDVAESNSSEIRAEKNEISTEQNLGDYEGNLIGGSSSAASESLSSVSDSSNWYQSGESYGSHPNYVNYGNYEGDYGNYDGNYGNYDGSATMAPATMAPITTASEVSGVIENVARLQGKRGRSDIPTEIIEVKQDELMKNRPREDQVKATGIAFGPAYQPVSSKGKPTKLHKRKHQIGSLYFDMKQKEMELSERRSKGFLTKAETQAKYGW